ncbi:MAG TPA: TIGR03435 family protein, partial [Candidatus Sulfopaludibacter sp.]|nr:TIGR03435 family protein [Candidatus Sulfopaludibacter sp.]
MRLLFVAGLAAACLYGRSEAEGPAFEVASIKPSPPRPPGGRVRIGTQGGPGTADPSRYTANRMSLSTLVITAYDIPFYRLSAPGWMDSGDFYDIVAKVPAGATKDQIPLMLQSLLAERFHLEVHHETNEMTGYEMVVAKNGPKLTPSSDAPPPQDSKGGPPKFAVDSDGFPVMPPGREGMTMMHGKVRWQARKVTTERLAQTLSVHLERPVRDATGLTGEYDLQLTWVADMGARAAPPPSDGGGAPVVSEASGPTILEAVQQQLGLRLEQKQQAVIHIASHGVYDDRDPLLSGVLLADGRLSVQDLLDAKIPADLLTLSGCLTGISAQQPGDELVALSRAALAAGVPSIVTTLWEVPDDPTREFF